MPKTPDRRPGPTEEDEEIIFYENLNPPTVSGAFNFDGNDFVFYDQLGYFNPRGGGIFTVSGGFANTAYSASFGSGSYASDVGADVFFYVSGSPGSIGTTTRGAAAFGGDLVVTGSSRFYGGLSGSLTKLANGTSYLIAGTNVLIASQSNGSVTISATGGGGSPGGFDTYVQYNDGGNFGGDPNFTFNETTNTLTVTNVSGSLTRLSSGASYLVQSGNITITSASNGSVRIGTTAVNSTEHAKLRQLIHLADEGGPFEGFTAGSYREVLPTGDPFPTSVIWWEDSSKTKKIVEETITYNSLKLITTDEWKVYNTDGVTVVVTATDTINYSGAFETNRTRTIT